MAEWPCCHDPLRFSPVSLRFVPPPPKYTSLNVSPIHLLGGYDPILGEILPSFVRKKYKHNTDAGGDANALKIRMGDAV